MDIHDELRKHLAEGGVAYSFALGRVGEIMSVAEPGDIVPVEVCPKSRTWKTPAGHNHTHGATSFAVGDAVAIQQRQDADGKLILIVVNKDLM